MAEILYLNCNFPCQMREREASGGKLNLLQHIYKTAKIMY